MIPKKSAGISEKARIQQAWKINARLFHETIEDDIKQGRYRHRIELHHGCGRTGCRKACRLLFVPLTPSDHNSQEVINYWREELRQVEERVMSNYIKYIGCQEILDYRCVSCLNYGK